MDEVQKLFDEAVRVHVAFRPYKYNLLVDGSRTSAHMARTIKNSDGEIKIAAVDFSIELGLGSPGANCDEIRRVVTPKLAELDMRMEDYPGSEWVHLDTKPIPLGGTRLFKPIH
jgi:hypothetical protein